MSDRSIVAWLLPWFAAPALAAQQGVYLTGGRELGGSPAEATWHVTFEHDIAGPLSADVSGMILPGARPATGALYGAGADLTLFAAAPSVPTFVVGVAGGIGTGGQEHLWAAGSFGIRMPIVVIGNARLMAEGRWRSLTITGRNGVELGITIGYRARRRDPGAHPERSGLWVVPPTAEILRARGIPDDKARLLGNVVSTAVEEMGQPYVWGGTGNGNGGFDCSGLIQYAYSRYGIRLPRTALGQAGAGTAIRRDLDALLPGDILIFSDKGGEPTHVGLFVGEGRFIHSSSSGVRLSRLAEDDVEGRGWLRRWIGVRRIVD